MHHPRPATPLTATFEAPAFAEGTSAGFTAIGIPMRMLVRIINGYHYYSREAPEEDEPFPPPWWPHMQQEFAKRLSRASEQWETEYLPEVQSINERLRSFDYAGASLDGLLAFIDEAFRMRVRAWDIHMQVVIPVMAAAGQFGELYKQVTGEPDTGRAFLLLQGFENKSVEAGAALWRLSRRVRARPTLAQLLEESPPRELPQRLVASDEGRALWDELRAYLDAYGWRSDAFELADAAWAEDPAIPLTALRDLARAPDDSDPLLKEARCREERERLVAETLQRLDGHEQRPLFEAMLPLAQQYLPIQENHNFFIDQMNTVLLRLPFLELGRRLVAAGALREQGDVFYLRREELAPAARGPRTHDWPALVDERRAERARWAAVVPPRELGTRPPEGTPANPWSDAFWGTRPEPSRDPKVITGIGASAGTVTATARVVRSLAEAGKLQPGDALVCEMTMPAWTPLFASVAAVVADSGGVLSHCAIVAREYRIPCVVGTHVGTQTLRDGQRITVDGAKGIVRIEE
jgi:pyruvate,water dikinase